MPGPDASGFDSALPDVQANDAATDGRPPDAAPDAAFDAEAGFDSGTQGLLTTLATAAPFVVLGGATVTNSGVSTVLEGDVGTTGPAITGLTGKPFQPTGSTEINNARAIKAVADLSAAFVALNAKPCPPANNLTGEDLGGMTLAPGVYCFSSAAGQISSTTLTFDAKGDPNAVWIIQIGTALTVMDGAHAVVIGGPASLACRIFWTTGTAVTLNSNVEYVGNFLAKSATTMLTNTRLAPGRAFGETGGVTLLSDFVSAKACP